MISRMSKIEKVFPTEEELSMVSSQVRCSAENCSAIFKSTSNLNMHLIRHHKLSGEELRRNDSVRQYYCPSSPCVYNKESKKYFKKLKYLKQHFLKVHAVKHFVCPKCDKKFATESFKNMHTRTCGTLFPCTCGFVYNSVEALLTHCKRKGHMSISPNSKHWEDKNVRNEAFDSKVALRIKKSDRPICPKLSQDVHYPGHHIAAIALSELAKPCDASRMMDKSIQTEFKKSESHKELRHNSGIKTGRKQNSSQQTQTTGKSKNVKISTETQTNNEYLKNKSKTPSKAVTARKRKKSMETQTREQLNVSVPDGKSKMTPCKNRSDKKAAQYFDSEILVENLFQDVSCDYMKDNLNSQTVIHMNDMSNMSENKSFINKDELLNKSTNLSSETSDKQILFNSNIELSICNNGFESDLSELNLSCKKLGGENETESMYLMEGGSYNVFDINKLCNIETQTEIDSFLTECSDDSFTLCSTTETQTVACDPLLYSNMYTQTCDEVDQLFNFNFVDIETQTAWPDL